MVIMIHTVQLLFNMCVLFKYPIHEHVLIPFPVFFFFCRFTAVASFKTSLMAMTSTGAIGCAMSTQPVLWLNRTWWLARTAETSTSTPSGLWSPNRSCWSGTARSSPRGSAANRMTSNRVSVAEVEGFSACG